MLRILFLRGMRLFSQKIQHLSSVKSDSACLFSLLNLLMNTLTKSNVGRSDRSDLRHVRLHLGIHVRDRYDHSDLYFSFYSFTCMRKTVENRKLNNPADSGV